MKPNAQAVKALKAAYARSRGTSRMAVRQPGTPRQPKGAELLYVRELRAMVAKLGKAVEEETAPILSRMDAASDGVPETLMERFAAIIESTVSAGIVQNVIGAVDQHNIKDISRVLGIGPELLVPGLADAMVGWRRENVSLIRSIGDEYLSQVNELVTEATTQGIRAEALKQQLIERLGVAQSRAELIAVDQTLKANAQLAQERYQRVGVTSYKWSTSRDERVRPGHAALEGHVYRYDSPPVVDPKTGRRENPGRDFRCRCVAIAVLDD